MPTLTDKTVLITGATSGIGLEAAVAIARMGARLIMVGRDPLKTARKVEEVRRRAGVSQVDSLLCDLSSQAQVRLLAAQVHEKYDKLHVLVNNAGAVFLRRMLSEDGVEMTFAVNYLSPFLLTTLLLDRLMESAPARVVNVSSAAHLQGTIDFADLGFARRYWVMAAYARAKLATILFTRELEKRLAGTGVAANALHPGTVATAIWDVGPRWTRPVFNLAKRLVMLSPEQGAETIVYLATSPAVAGHSGLYFEKNQPRLPSRLAQDEALARRLWDESTRLVTLSAPD